MVMLIPPIVDCGSTGSFRERPGGSAFEILLEVDHLPLSKSHPGKEVLHLCAALADQSENLLDSVVLG